MQVVHSFRLRRPWQCESANYRTRWSRNFHRPTGLDPDLQLWLVISGLPDDAIVSINGVTLETPEPQRPGQFHVTDHVEETNAVVIDAPAQPDLDADDEEAFPFDVRLGIVEP